MSKSAIRLDTEANPPIASYVIGGLSVTLKRGEKQREFIIEVPATSSAFAMLTPWFTNHFNERFDCECSPIGLLPHYATIANSVVQPLSGIAIQGFARDEKTSRESLGCKELQSMLAAMATTMPGRAEFSDYIEKCEENDARRSEENNQLILSSKSLPSRKPEGKPSKARSYTIGRAKVLLTQFPGEQHFHLSFEGSRYDSWELAKIISSAIAKNKFVADCKVPLFPEYAQVYDHHFITLNPKNVLDEKDFAAWYHMGNQPQMLIFPAISYDNKLITSGKKIPLFSHIDEILEDLSEIFPASVIRSDEKADYTKPKGSPKRAEDFTLSNRQLTLEQYEGDKRLHLWIGGGSACDMVEPLIVIAKEISKHNPGWKCVAVTEYEGQQHTFDCIIDPEFEGHETSHDYANPEIDILDHFTNPTHMVIYMAGSQSATPAFSEAKEILERLSERYPPFASDLYRAFVDIIEEVKSTHGNQKLGHASDYLEKRITPYLHIVGAVIPEADAALKVDLQTRLHDAMTSQNFSAKFLSDIVIGCLIDHHVPLPAERLQLLKDGFLKLQRSNAR